jgi:hypothetical protein
VQRFQKHVYTRALWELYNWLGEHDGALAVAGLRVVLDSKESRVMLASRGVKTLGEVGE